MGSYGSATQPVYVKQKHDTIWNILTFVILLSTLCAALAFLVIFINPQVSFNPFPPSVQAMNAALPSPDESPTRAPVEVVRTAEPTDAPAEPTSAPTPDQAGEAVILQLEPAPIQPVAFAGEYAFDMQGTPAPVASTIMKAETGCSWMGVAGQALDTRNSPVTGLLVKLSGTLDGKPVDLVSMTGTETVYGDAGFELIVADQPLESRGTLQLQLLDNALLPMSAPIAIDSTADCQKNLILVTFRQVKEY